MPSAAFFSAAQRHCTPVRLSRCDRSFQLGRASAPTIPQPVHTGAEVGDRNRTVEHVHIHHGFAGRCCRPVRSPAQCHFPPAGRAPVRPSGLPAEGRADPAGRDQERPQGGRFAGAVGAFLADRGRTALGTDGATRAPPWVPNGCPVRYPGAYRAMRRGPSRLGKPTGSRPRTGWPPAPRSPAGSGSRCGTSQAAACPRSEQAISPCRGPA
jgi:hypothetical protein